MSSPKGEGAAPELSVVLCNCPPDQAGDIARKIVERRLAACVNLIPGVVSYYWWEGKVEQDGESTLLLKTPTALVGRLTEALRGLHPYDVPEIIALPVTPGLGEPAYHAWVVAETAGAQAPEVGA